MKKRINLFIILGLILGVLGGIFFPKGMNEIAFLGTIYLSLLKFMIIPVIFSTVMVSAYNYKLEKDRKIIKTILIFILMFISIFLITSLVGYLIDFIPVNLNLVNEVGTTSLNISDIFTNMFPDNIVSMISNNSILFCIIIAFISGMAATKGENGRNVIDFMTGIKNICNKIIEWIMYLTPFGVLALIGTTIADYGTSIIGVGATYIGIAYLCSLVAILLMMIPVWIKAKINPFIFIKRIGRLMFLTISTCSSLAVLPETIKICKKEFQISDKNADILVPLGCTIHKCGGAVSFALLGIFCSKLFGIDITISSYLFMLLSALLINMAAPGIPSGGIVLGATYLSLLNIPLSFMGIYAGIYRLLDMPYTTLNVTGNVVANIVINENLKKLKKENKKNENNQR